MDWKDAKSVANGRRLLRNAITTWKMKLLREWADHVGATSKGYEGDPLSGDYCEH
jgi:hypothetical protein